jgi:hypothetical protein
MVLSDVAALSWNEAQDTLEPAPCFLWGPKNSTLLQDTPPP